METKSFKKRSFAVVLATILLLVALPITAVLAASSGPNSAGAGASVSFTGSDHAWSNPGNVTASDDAWATATITSSSNVTDYLQATNFGFSIPVGATINGIQVEVEKSENCSGCTSHVRDNLVRIIKGGTVQTAQNKALGSTNWSTTDAYTTYGGAADLWGVAWTAADINASNFGVAISAGRTGGGDITARVDHVRITVTYTAPNTPPTITEGASTSVTMSEDGSPTAFSLTLNATDPDAGQTLTWSISSAASHGTATASGTGTSKSIGYTPNANYNGSDAFTVQVSDGAGGTDTIVVNVTIEAVNDAPVANAQSVSTNEDTALPITLTGSDVDLDTLSFAVVDSPLHGVLSGTAPDISYTPEANYNGPDSFTFKVNDGAVDSAPATVSITVNPVNDAPVANAQNVGTLIDTPQPITLTGSDVDLDTLTFAIVDNPLHGVLSGTAPDVTYTPDSGYVGPDSFTFKVNDGTVDSAPATVSIIVNAVNSAPTDISLSPSNVDENKPAGSLVGALSTTDPDGGTFTYSFCGGADDSSFQFSGSNLLTAAVFDYELKNSYSICVRSTDNGSLFFDKTLTVTVNNKIDTASFADVPTTYWSWTYIESIYAAHITGGCGVSPLIYCPTDPVTRAQMAVFLLRGIHGNSYAPPAATGTKFADVSASYWAASWIEQLATEGYTSGCGGGNYCPDDAVTRDQMAVFLLRAKHGVSYTPPAATGVVFSDVPSSYWSGAWIEQLASEGITSGCGGGNYCPTSPVTRDQMAVFLQRVFNLPLP